MTSLERSNAQEQWRNEDWHWRQRQFMRQLNEAKMSGPVRRLASQLALDHDWRYAASGFTTYDIGRKLERDHSTIVKILPGLREHFYVFTDGNGTWIAPLWDGIERSPVMRCDRKLLSEEVQNAVAENAPVQNEAKSRSKMHHIGASDCTTKGRYQKPLKNPSRIFSKGSAQARATLDAEGARARAPNRRENAPCQPPSESDLPNGTPGSPITPEPNSTTVASSWNGTVRTRAGRLRKLDGLCPPSGPPETPEQRKATADRIMAELKASRMTLTDGRFPPTPHEIELAERRAAIMEAIEPIAIVPPAPPPAPAVSPELVATVQKLPEYFGPSFGNPKFSGPMPRVETQKAPDDLSPWGEGE